MAPGFLNLVFVLFISFLLVQTGGPQRSKAPLVFSKNDRPMYGLFLSVDGEEESALKEVSGEIIGSKALDVKGTTATNIVVLLKTNKNNRRLVIDLGPVEELKDFDIKKERMISVQGQMTSIQHVTFMVAKKVKVGDKLFELDRKVQEDQVRKSPAFMDVIQSEIEKYTL